MAFGHNSNVTVAGATYHVQTEERGPAQALIDTTVYFRGQVLHRRTNSFLDLLPLNPDREVALKLRVEEQHRGIVEEIRSGKLRLGVENGEKAQPRQRAAASGPASDLLHLELLNAKTWLSGKHAILQIAVNDAANKSVANATIMVRVEGAAEPSAFSADTNLLGRAKIEFDMPALVGPEVTLVIEASKGKARGQLRFQLRAKPHVPSAG